MKLPLSWIRDYVDITEDIDLMQKNGRDRAGN